MYVTISFIDIEMAVISTLDHTLMTIQSMEYISGCYNWSSGLYDRHKKKIFLIGI